MRILLYKPDSLEGSFRSYGSPQDVLIDGEKVNIIKNGFIVESFKLVKACNPSWTDETKPLKEVLVKIIVEPLKIKVNA